MIKNTIFTLKTDMCEQADLLFSSHCNDNDEKYTNTTIELIAPASGFDIEFSNGSEYRFENVSNIKISCIGGWENEGLAIALVALGDAIKKNPGFSKNIDWRYTQTIITELDTDTYTREVYIVGDKNDLKSVDNCLDK